MLATLAISGAFFIAPIPKSHKLDNLGRVTDIAPVTRTVKVKAPSTKPDKSEKPENNPDLSNQSSDDMNSDLYKGMDPYEAKIVYMESRGNDHASNGHYYGLFQLDPAYLKGDYSRDHQFKVAKQYLNDRYNGSWKQAYDFHIQHNWW